MIRSIIIGVLALGLIATSYWGYTEHEQNALLANNVEAGYQRAYHTLVYHVDQLEDDLGAVLAMNTKRHISPKLTDIWRVTSHAQSEIGQLPLGMMELHEAEKFLHDLGDFSYKTAVRDLETDPLTDEEYDTLEHLYHMSTDVRNELRKAQASLLRNNMLWMDIEQEFQALDEPIDNTVINGFETVNEKVTGYSETEWGAGFSQMDAFNDEDLAERLNGEKITEEEARQKALDFIGIDENVEVHVAETGDGLAYKAYSLTIDDPNHETNYFMDITESGGHVLWFLQYREIAERNISLNEAAENAKEFLERNGIEGMQLVESKQYDSIGAFEFAYLQDNVRVYADHIVIEVALDDGDVIAYEAEDYLLNHKDDRDLEEPNITKEEARDHLNGKLEVMEDHLAIIVNDLGEEVLCYEFYGVIDNDTYRIFINVEDGQEELVEKLDNAEPVYNLS
ncbi:germination protein YpeB [Alkalihalobacterium chitinilyticum]|uniref:Germination protein YpeB n=1 Tax=Alkalihalobacterium chitinilyticum TaxID=2980103 RepID=A0ABT5V908_9BACI|nr:germination protein YpeB [Alkalihalobacterium chitinilyticum]MDE5411949.1 germination protein YpeB [Alkalihalobacterium chitinilyticum]